MTLGSSFPLGASRSARWRELQRVLETRHGRAAAPLRSRGRERARPGDRPGPADPALVPLLACVRAGPPAGSVLRLPGRRAVRPVPRTSFRPRQGAPGSVRTVRRAARGVESRGGPAAGRQLRLGLEERGHRFQPLSVGRRPAAAYAVHPDRGLRDARRGLHPQPELRRAGVAARHVSGRDRQDSVPAGSRVSPPSNCCPSSRSTSRTRRAGSTTGATSRCRSSRRIPGTARGPTRSASSTTSATW